MRPSNPARSPSTPRDRAHSPAVRVSLRTEGQAEVDPAAELPGIVAGPEESSASSHAAVGAREALRMMVEVALPVARQRAHLVEKLRAALETGDNQAALTLAREVAGL